MTNPSHPSAPDPLAVDGTLDSTALRLLLERGHVMSATPFAPGQVQPASLDLRLGAEGFRMPGSVLPRPGENVADLVRGLALEPIDLSRPTCLARNQVYVVRLRESLRLPPDMQGYANGKSSTGRIDLATRVLSDGSQRYDRISAGYQGDLWIELIPRSFNLVVSAGISLNQIIFYNHRHVLDHEELLARHRRQPLLRLGDGSVAGPDMIADGRVMMGVDLDRDRIGFVAKSSHRPVVLADLAAHRAEDFFAPVPRPSSGLLFLEKDRFYILATAERVIVPADLACEMVPFDPTAGEFRAHYAGFFDPGWGIHGEATPGAPAVLEVRPHQDDLILRHRQPICAMAFEALQRPCQELYGTCGNTYARQEGPRLSKHFS